MMRVRIYPSAQRTRTGMEHAVDEQPRHRAEQWPQGLHADQRQHHKPDEGRRRDDWHIADSTRKVTL